MLHHQLVLNYSSTALLFAVPAASEEFIHSFTCATKRASWANGECCAVISVDKPLFSVPPFFFFFCKRHLLLSAQPTSYQRMIRRQPPAKRAGPAPEWICTTRPLRAVAVGAVAAPSAAATRAWVWTTLQKSNTGGQAEPLPLYSFPSSSFSSALKRKSEMRSGAFFFKTRITS